MCALIDRKNIDGNPVTQEYIKREVLLLPVDNSDDDEGHMEPSDSFDSEYLDLAAFKTPDEKHLEYNDYTIKDDDSYLDKFISKRSLE